MGKQKRSTNNDQRGKTKVRWVKLPQLSVLISILALAVSMVTCGTTWFVYFSGTKPQTDFQRVDVELQSVKNRIDREFQVNESLRNKGADITWREETLGKARAVHNEAWEAWLERDYEKAEALLRDSAKLLPPPPLPGPSTSIILIMVITVVSLGLLLFSLLRKWGFIVIE